MSKKGDSHLISIFRHIRPMIHTVLDQESCWEWRGKVTKDGNPSYHYTNSTGQRSTGTVGRLVFMVAHHVKLGHTHLVCGSCDNSRCVRPSHLFKDLCRDVSRANGVQFKRGHTPPMRRLTREQAMEIRFSKEQVIDLAKRFSVSKATVYAIRNRRFWK